uniref:Uncharacterized protein n=1 Tax=Opuntia streptacantha TaxID=393608 RepID=A0A7C8ZTB9_OPUST
MLHVKCPATQTVHPTLPIALDFDFRVITSLGLRIGTGEGGLGLGLGLRVGVQLGSCFGFRLGCGRRSGRVSGLGQKNYNFFPQLTSLGLYFHCMVVEDARGVGISKRREDVGRLEGGEPCEARRVGGCDADADAGRVAIWGKRWRVEWNGDGGFQRVEGKRK